MLVFTFLIILAVLLGYWLLVFRMRRRRLYELADKLPGAPQMPFIGHMHLFMGDTEVIHKTLKDASDLSLKQGGITKLWIGHMLFCMLTDPVDIEFVLKTCLDKDEITHFATKALGNGIIFAPASIWRRLRKNMAPGFTTKNLDTFFEHFRDKSDLLTKQLQSQAAAGELDLWPFVSSYTLDSIFETVCGIDTTQQNQDYDKALWSMSELLRLSSERFFHPWLHPDWLYRLSSSYNTYNNSSKFAHSFIDNIIENTKTNIQKEELQELKSDENRVNETRKWTSFLRLLINQSSKSQPYTNLELREEVLSIGGAGTDTTSVGICFTLMLLGRHQDIQDRLHQELVEVFGKSERPLVKEDLSKLCYLEQVLKESLRLYPPVPFISRQANKETILPSGKVLPAGCGVPMSIIGMHRNPAYWGADAEMFRPERFSPERYKPQHACVYMPFSSGIRNCLGYQYAMTSMKTALVTILRKYRVRVTGDPTAHIRVKYEIMTKPVDGFKVILERKV